MIFFSITKSRRKEKYEKATDGKLLWIVLSQVGQLYCSALIIKERQVDNLSDNEDGSTTTFKAFFTLYLSRQMVGEGFSQKSI